VNWRASGCRRWRRVTWKACASDDGLKAQAILLFWFGPRPYTAAGLKQRERLWFPDAPELIAQTDELIDERFGAVYAAAERGEFTPWESTPRRRLALILLFDQFSRCLHRATAAAFAHDRQALQLALSGLQYGADAALDPVERLFFYMPLQHAESRDVQEESVAAFRRLCGEAQAALKPWFENALKFAVLHRDIVARFGRFPHRNRALGRESTAQEETWLATEGESFGQ
jgi:uncharacterized protein (DUF924 family)